MKVPRDLLPYLRHHDTSAPPAAVASVAITPAAPAVRVGETIPLSAAVRDTNGDQMEGRTLAWASSDAGVATVNASTGALTGVSVGTAEITATDTLSGVVSTPVTATVTAVPSADETGKWYYLASGTRGSLTSGEQSLISAMEGWGWTFDVRAGTNASNLDLSTCRGVIISASANVTPGITQWQDSWIGVDVPMVMLNWKMPAVLGLCADFASLTDSGTYTRSPLLLPGVEETAPGDLQFANPNSLGKWGKAVSFVGVSPHAQTWLHAQGDHFAPAFCVHERGETQHDGTAAPARRAWGGFGFSADYGRITTAGKQFLRNVLKWAAADPHAGVVPQMDFARSYSPGATQLTATDDTVVPAGRTIVSDSWTLWDEDAAVVVASGSGPTFTPPPLADGTYQLDRTVTPDVGPARTKRRLFRAELVAPLAGFTFGRVDGSPDDNYIAVTSTAVDHGVPITDTHYVAYRDSAGTDLAWESTTGDPNQTIGPLPNASYWVGQVLTNEDGQIAATLLQRIDVPTPPLNLKARVLSASLTAYAACLAVPARSDLTLTFDWDFDLDNPGTLVGTGPHPGVGARNLKPSAPTPGTRRWSCTIRQSNGSVTTIKGQWCPWTPPDHSPGQDYTRPPLPGTSRVRYLDADAATDGTGTEASPYKLLSSALMDLSQGTMLNLAGDFRPQATALKINNKGGSAASGIVLQQWVGKSQAILGGAIDGNTVQVANTSYLCFSGIRVDAQQRLSRLDNGIVVTGGSHVYFFDTQSLYGWKGFLFTNCTWVWIDGCLADFNGFDPRTTTAADGWANGGYGVYFDGFCDHYTVARSTIGRAGHTATELNHNTWQKPADEQEFSGQLKHPRYGRWYDCEIYNEWSGSFGSSGLEGSLIEYCDIHDIGHAQQIEGGHIGSRDALNIREIDNTTRHCRIWLGCFNALYMQDNSLKNPQQCIGLKFYHNTFFLNADGEKRAADGTVVATASYNAALRIVTGDVVDFLFTEDIEIYNNNFAYNHGYEHTDGVQYQIYALNQNTEWNQQHVWQIQGGPGGTPAAHFGGISIHHNNFYPLQGVPSGFLLYARGGLPSSDVFVKYPTPADAEASFPERVYSNLQVEPQFVSQDPADLDAGFLELAPSSPLVNAGVAVPGIDYSATGGNVPIGWHPAL